jgi:predicted GNAT family acetyltransferase
MVSTLTFSADAVRTDPHLFNALSALDEKSLALRVLTRTREGLVQRKVAISNELTSALKRYFPLALELFRGLDSAEAVSFLSQYPTYHEARTVSESRIQSILRKQGFSDKTAAKRAKTTRTRSFWSLCPASHLPLVQCWQQSLALISRVSATSRPSKPLPDQAR